MILFQNKGKYKIKKYKSLHNKKSLKYYLNNPERYLEDFNEVRAIQFELSSRCNLRCSFCSHQFKKNIGSDMPYVKALEYLDKLPDSINFIHLHFSGEAFLNRETPEIVKEITRRNIYTSASTNGTLLPDFYLKCLKNGLNELIFAIDGATKETHEKHRIGSNFDKIMKTLEAVIVNKPLSSRVGVQFLVTRDSENEIDIMKRKLNSMGADFFNLKTISLNIASDQRLESNKVQTAEMILPKNPKYSRYIIKRNKLKLKYPIIVCPFISNPVIASNGDVALCCIDIDKNVRIGNLNDFKNFEELWNSDLYRILRVSALKKDLNICKICNYSQIGLEPVEL